MSSIPLPPVPDNIKPLTRHERVQLLGRAMGAMKHYCDARGGVRRSPPPPPVTEPAWWAMQIGTYEITVRALEGQLAALRVENANLRADNADQRTANLSLMALIDREPLR